MTGPVIDPSTDRGLAVRHIDLRTGREPRGDGRAAFIVFWWRNLPLGVEAASAEEVPLGPAALRARMARFAGEQRAARDPLLGAPLPAGPEGLPQPTATLRAVRDVEDLIPWLDAISAPSDAAAADLSVIVCTRDRSEALPACLAAILAQQSPAGEVIVVDNSAFGAAAAACAAFPTVRYVHEPRPGLSHARNAGVLAATRGLVAFTDDDVEPHPGWTAEIVRAFGRTDAEAVTGLVLPGRLDTEAQRCFQLDMGGFGARFVPVLFERRFFAATMHHGAHVWRIGAGANMAFRRAVFDRVGLFDVRLGAGASGCSEDSELWYRILATGGSCLYEPSAVVFHDHRADWNALERQVRAYMKGHVSALVVQADRFGHHGNFTRIFRQLPRYFLRTATDIVLHPRPARRRLLRQEVLGWAAGLGYLVRRGWRRRTLPPGDGGSAGSHAPRRPDARAMIHKRPLGDFLRRNPFGRGWTDGLFYREKMRAIHRIAPAALADGARILEVGGGRSGMAAMLYPRAHVITLDIDPSLADSPNVDRRSYVCGDACKLPFGPGAFDVVTLFDVLEHVLDDRVAASEAMRVTRSGGSVLVSTPEADWHYPYYAFMRPVCPKEQVLMDEWGHVRRGYAPDALQALFGRAPDSRASFINPITAFFHDIAFSRLGSRRRKLLYGLAALPTAIGYALHRRSTRGTETACAWRQ